MNKKEDVSLSGCYNWFGNHPFPPEKKRPTILDENNDVMQVYGKGRELIAPRVFASTDKILMSIWDVPPGQSFQPPDIHSGDEPYYIVRGRPTISNPETGLTIQAKEGDAVFIPKKTWHCVYNFTDEPVTIIAIIEGELWDEGDLEEVNSFEMKKANYKYEQ